MKGVVGSIEYTYSLFMMNDDPLGVEKLRKTKDVQTADI
jgi:hypothetical protein